MAFLFNDLRQYLAERGGFEPPRRYKRLPDFESGTFNHSATSPVVRCRWAAESDMISGDRAGNKAHGDLAVKLPFPTSTGTQAHA